jgi:hypothetical protein
VYSVANPGISPDVELYRDWLYNSANSGAFPSQLGLQAGPYETGGTVGAGQCIFGPYLSDSIAHVGGGLSLSNCLFIDSPYGNILSDPSTNYPINSGPTHIDRCTSFVDLFSNAFCLDVDEGSYFSTIGTPSGPFAPTHVTSSIFYGGSCGVDPSNQVGILSRNNTQYKVTGNTLVLGSEQADPEFISDVSQYSPSTPFSTLVNTNFALSKGSPAAGTGSSITSVQQLLRLIH